MSVTIYIVLLLQCSVGSNYVQTSLGGSMFNFGEIFKVRENQRPVSLDFDQMFGACI